MSHYEMQVKYNTGWETVTAVDHPEAARWGWAGFRLRYRHLKTRLLAGGKPCRYG